MSDDSKGTARGKAFARNWFAANPDPQKLSQEETAEYLTEVEWRECEKCVGVGCKACGDEGGKMEAIDD